MNFDIFDESYYLAKYAWLKPAVEQGIIKSGLDHFQRFGLKQGLTEVSRYYNESYYLANNPSIATAVSSSAFASGLDHFIQFGYEQGYANVSPNYDEAFYVKRHPDLLPFIQNGTFKSGFQHFIKFGAKEGRYGTSFFEPLYLKNYPNIADAVNSAIVTSGREHYLEFGQLEPNRLATFTGTSGNDVVTGLGLGTHQIVGVSVALASVNVAGVNWNRYESLGTNEFDVLIGSPGVDYFVLGEAIAINRPGLLDRVTFYRGNGEATLVNFEKGKDYILFSQSPNLFNIFPLGNDLIIQEVSNSDTIARIQGGANLSLRQIFQTNPFNNPAVSYTLLG